MGYRLVEMVLESSVSDPTETAVLIALASHADKYFSCYPSIARICKLSRYKERAVQGAIKRLSARGVITVKTGGGRGGASFYVINPSTLNPAADATFKQEKPRSRNTVSDDKTPHLIPETPHLTTENPAADADEPVREPVKKRSNGAREEFSAFDLVADLTHALGFDHHGTVPKYWITPDAPMIVGRWVIDLGLTPEEIIFVAKQNARAHGDPAKGPKTLNKAMQDYAGAKDAPRLEPTKGTRYDPQSARTDHRAAARSDATAREIAFAARAIRTPSSDCF